MPDMEFPQEVSTSPDSTGALFKAIEDWFNHPDTKTRGTRRTDAIGRIKKGWGVALGVDLDNTLTPLNADNTDHFRKDWLGENLGPNDKKWWSGIAAKTVKDDIGQAFLDALQYPNSPDIRIEWNCRDTDIKSKVFTAWAVYAGSHVTIQINTPRTPNMPET
jgi:hypothetical protein